MGTYTAETDPFGSDKEHPVSHVAYSYSTQVAVLDDDLRVAKLTAACDVGQVVNLQSLTGQVEGGITMGMGYALTEDFPIGEDGDPAFKFATIGLLKATEVPPIEVITVQGPSAIRWPTAQGSGRAHHLATAPAIAAAYYRTDHIERNRLRRGRRIRRRAGGGEGGYRDRSRKNRLRWNVKKYGNVYKVSVRPIFVCPNDAVLHTSL